MKDIKVGVIGLGARGSGMLKSVVLQVPGVSVLWVCDLYEDRVKAGAESCLGGLGEQVDAGNGGNGRQSLSTKA